MNRLIGEPTQGPDRKSSREDVALALERPHPRGFYENLDDGSIYVYDGFNHEPVIVRLPAWANNAVTFGYMIRWLEEEHPKLRRA